MALPNPKFISKAFRLSIETANFGWLVTDKLIRLAAGLFVSMLVARYLGPSRFGLLAYASSVIALLVPLAELGVDAVVRRKLLSAPADAGLWIGVVWRARLSIGIGLYAALFCWLAIFRGEVGATELVLILGLGLLQPAGMTADIWLQANLKARLAVVVSWIALGSGALVRIYLVNRASDLTAFAWVAVGEGAVNCLLTWFVAKRAGLPKLARAHRNLFATARLLIAEAWPLLLAGLTITLYMRIDMVMLRQLAGDHQTGTYAAAVRLSELWYFVPMALASSVLPGLLRKKSEGPEMYAGAMQSYYDLSAGLAYVGALLTCLLADPLVRATYGAAYDEAVPVLRWHAWSMVFVFLGVARSQFLVNENMTLFYLAATASGAILNIVLNCWLIPSHGAIGAAWATLAAYALAAWGASWLHPLVRVNAVMQTRALLVPVFGWRRLLRQ